MEIKVGEFYKTRGGDKAECIMKLAGTNKLFPFVICVTCKDGEQNMFTSTECGRKWEHTVSPYDLVAPWPKKVKVEGWLNVYKYTSFSYETKEDADNSANKDRIACVKIDMEVEEGEGL